MHSPAVSYTIPCLLLLLSPSQEVLHSGQGWSQRDGESGQLLVDRGRHLDTLEWSFMINSFSNKLYYKWVATGHWALGSCSCCQCCKGTPVLICKFFAFAATYVCRTAEATTLWLQQVRSRPASAWFGRANIHGDKDTFALAFALAGKAHEYAQVQLPPGGWAPLPQPLPALPSPLLPWHGAGSAVHGT